MTRAEVLAMHARSDASQLRRDAGISLATVARAFAVTEKEVWRWEHGRHVPCSETARRWARFTLALERRAAFRRGVLKEKEPEHW